MIGPENPIIPQPDYLVKKVFFLRRESCARCLAHPPGLTCHSAQDTRFMPPAHPRPWHARSVFGPGPRRPLDRDHRARFKFLLRAHGRAGRIPSKQERVGESLLKRLGTNGQCDPTHDTLADDAGCNERTVRRALDTLKGLGLVLWANRLIRDGWRTSQTSNAYLLVPAETGTTLPTFPASRCGGHSGRQTLQESFTLLPATAEAIADAHAALARRRAVVEAMLGRG